MIAPDLLGTQKEPNRHKAINLIQSAAVVLKGGTLNQRLKIEVPMSGLYGERCGSRAATVWINHSDWKPRQRAFVKIWFTIFNVASYFRNIYAGDNIKNME